jgi:hypothetical protein
MIDTGMACLGIFAAFLIAVVGASLAERRRLERAERAFLAGRVPLADEDFLRRAEAGTGEAEFFLTARRVMAGLCGLDPEEIHPEDTVRSLLDLQPDRGWIQDFVFSLEYHTGVKLLPYRYPPDEQTFGEYVRGLARVQAARRQSDGGPGPGGEQPRD